MLSLQTLRTFSAGDPEIPPSTPPEVPPGQPVEVPGEPVPESEPAPPLEVPPDSPAEVPPSAPPETRSAAECLPAQLPGQIVTGTGCCGVNTACAARH
jgi:hypothetical protein